jgi:hypothetical protein
MTTMMRERERRSRGFGAPRLAMTPFRAHGLSQNRVA